jgi:nucleoside-diphosphate-sugar epimerase
MKRILVTGAAGQIGTELVLHLRQALGASNVLATDLKIPEASHPVVESGPFAPLDCTDGSAVRAAVASHQADTVFHLAALLSATGERNPSLAWAVNVGGLFEVLEAARHAGAAVFTPSSIAAFGPETPRDPTPQDTIQRPTSMYGVTKVAGELLCDYYHTRYGVDTRGLRYPGLISHTAPPGGGTTDWAIEIFHEAIDHNHYASFLSADTQLDMMYMEDAIRASIELMEADGNQLRHRNAFNVTAFQVTPTRMAEVIQTHRPSFTLSESVDPMRQAIADSWPRRIDDVAARSEWGWAPRWTLEAVVSEMLTAIEAQRRGATPTP